MFVQCNSIRISQVYCVVFICFVIRYSQFVLVEIGLRYVLTDSYINFAKMFWQTLLLVIFFIKDIIRVSLANQISYFIATILHIDNRYFVVMLYQFFFCNSVPCLLLNLCISAMLVLNVFQITIIKDFVFYFAPFQSAKS